MTQPDDSKIQSVSVGGGGDGPQGPQGVAGSGGNQGPQGVAGSDTGLPIPGYAPPAFQWKSVDDLYIMAGRYYPLGHRISGQYQGTTIGNYWSVSTPFSVTVLDTYSAGSSSGILGGVSSGSTGWLSVYMMAADEIMFVPWIRVPDADYNTTHTGKTTITPGEHNASATADLITANDQFNGFRLVKHSYRSDPYHGYTATIEDTINDTADELIIDGDVTAAFGTGDTDVCTSPWLQLVPPAGTDCLYLGQVLIDGSGNMKGFQRFGKWSYNWRYMYRHNVNLSADNSANGFELTTVRNRVPPTAIRAMVLVMLSTGSDYQHGHQVRFACEDFSDGYISDWAPNASTNRAPGGWIQNGGNSDYSRHAFPVPWIMTYPSAIRMRGFGQVNGVENTTISGSFISPYIFEE